MWWVGVPCMWMADILHHVRYKKPKKNHGIKSLSTGAGFYRTAWRCWNKHLWKGSSQMGLETSLPSQRVIVPSYEDPRIPQTNPWLKFSKFRDSREVHLDPRKRLQIIATHQLERLAELTQKAAVFEASWDLPVIVVLISGGALDISSIKDLPQVAGILWMGPLHLKKISGGRWGTRNNIHYGILCHEVHFCRVCDHGLAWYVFKYSIHVALLKPHHMYAWLWISQGACSVRLDVHGIIQRLHSQKLLQSQLEQNVYPLTLRATSTTSSTRVFREVKTNRRRKKAPGYLGR